MSTVKIEQLDQSNYETWKIQVEAILIKNDAWGYVDGSIVKPAEPGEATLWESKDAKAKADLILSISPSELRHLRGCTTSRDIWLKLKAIHASKGPAKKATLLKQLLLYKLEEGGDIREHVLRFFDVRSQLADMDIELHDDLISIMLLYSLPSSFDNFRCAIESRDALPDPETLKIKILEEEHSRDKNDAVDRALLMKGKKYFKPKSGTEQGNSKFRYKCFKCHQYGHKSSECVKRKKEQCVDSAKIFLIQAVSSQLLNTTVDGNGICGTIHCRDLDCLRNVDKCIVIVGNFTFAYLGIQKPDMFKNMTFHNLKEITGYMAIYWVPVLESIGQLFPNLARIRGHDLLHNYALIVYDINQLGEIGLYNLLKIDRGGVVIWGGPGTCYIDTVNWEIIAPRYRHILSPANEDSVCKRICTCSGDAEFNYCWNNRKCQLFTEGAEALSCHEECLGCRLTNDTQCMLCRHFTHRQRCVPRCPDDTVILEENQYCLTRQECYDLGRWVWNNTCVNTCPDDYVKKHVSKTLNHKTTCVFCPGCKEKCGNLSITSLGTLQAAHRCVHINGSLSIHIRDIPDPIETMRLHLRKIQEVYDFIYIHDSIPLTSLDFLPSLRRIRGRKLVGHKYSLVIQENPSLQTLFLPNVTKNLKIDSGSLFILHNPMTCISEIAKLKKRFPRPPNGTADVPHGYGLNSYNSVCEEVAFGLNVTVVNETTAIVTFLSVPDSKINYSVLYVRVPPGTSGTVVPETCSKCEWHVKTAPAKSGRIELTSLRPSSTYLVCIESTDEKKLARSSILKFSTAVGKPEPPFIVELVADTPHVVVLNWVDHLDYLPHITHYELSVLLVEIHPEDINASNQCKNLEEVLVEEDLISRHAVVMRPPRGYGKACESMCGILSTVPQGAMVEEDLNICHFMGSTCNEIDEEPFVGNTSFGEFVRTLSFQIKSPRNAFQIAHLAPYRDYRFRLRACTKHQCSRSTRGVVRTLPSDVADVPKITGLEIDKTGIITVSWDAPAVSNGPVLAYTVLFIPDLKAGATGQTQTWCVSANQTKIVVSTNKNKDYGIQLCSLSLANRPGCTKLNKFSEQHSPTDWKLPGVIFAICLCVVSVLIGYLCPCKPQSDSIPLVDITSSYRVDSDPPIFSLLDLNPSLHESSAD